MFKQMELTLKEHENTIKKYESGEKTHINQLESYDELIKVMRGNTPNKV